MNFKNNKTKVHRKPETENRQNIRTNKTETDSTNHHLINLDFEEIVKQNKQRIYYQMQRLGIRDPHGGFYAEVLAMWMAYQKYEPDKGPLATYFNYMIRNRLIDKMRKNVREQEKDELFVEHRKQQSLKGPGLTHNATESFDIKLDEKIFG